MFELALAAIETAAGHRLGTLEGQYNHPFRCLSARALPPPPLSLQFPTSYTGCKAMRS